MYLIFLKHYRDQAKQQGGMYRDTKIKERNNGLNHRLREQPLKNLVIFRPTEGDSCLIVKSEVSQAR